MRRLFVLLLVVALGWSIYWFVAAEGTRRGFNAALDQANAQGWQITTSDVQTRGFPSRLDTTLSDVELTSPDAALTLEAAFLQILSLSYRPTHVIAVAPNDINLSVGGIPVVLKNEDMRASLSLAATPDLPLQQLSFVTEALTVSLSDMSVSTTNLRAAISGLEDAQYRLGLAASDVAWPQLGGETLQLNMDGVLTLNNPLDRHLAQSAAQPVALDLSRFQLNAGDGVRASLTGILNWQFGRPQGQLTLEIVNWRGFLERLQKLGLIAPEVLQGLSGQLPLIAEGDDVTLPLPVRNGVVYIGALPFLWLTPPQTGG
ncbi:DUF2125 domain-containing protein [Actibacterium mucosum]|nr:DUF2125 domain-containing protein [Actibacterium mucosum]